MARRVRDLQAGRSTAARAQVATGALLLDDPAARHPHLTGAKAASLAVAMANGLPVLPGAVLTTTAASPEVLRGAWPLISEGGRRAVAVRSSSTVEDQASSSMAGRFTTVLDVATWPDAIAAIGEVRSSGTGAPMAVLVQPMCNAALGGVLFGVDPVTGADRLVIEVVRGGPHALVSGDVTGSRVVLSRRGQILEQRGEQLLSHADCRHLAALAREAQRVFDRPQDIEWAIDTGGQLWLLQSRPVTTIAATPTGPRLGPGPVAETFPDALTPLEADLWVEPLRAAIRCALRITGSRSRKVLEASSILVDVGGRIAADLDVLEGRPRTRFTILDPRPGARRLQAAWRVGRLRRALPALADDVLHEVDLSLASVRRLDDLDERDLLALVGQCRLTLRALHGHEVLAGALLDEEDGASGIALALRAVAHGRAAGRSDEAIAASSPESLALLPPRIGASIAFPEVPAPTGAAGSLGRREALRLRARWVHELSARASLALGARLVDGGRLLDPLAVRWLRLDELTAMVGRGTPAPRDLVARIATDAAAPLPAKFRLSTDGAVVPLAATDSEGQGAGGGRGIGVVADPDGDVDAAGTVLVVRTLEPGLAARLAGRAGLVAETGSVLAHLAIVARELGVPTVVGVHDALVRFPPGTTVVVDGHSGQVEVVE